LSQSAVHDLSIVPERSPAYNGGKLDREIREGAQAALPADDVSTRMTG
jgi:hypothetical protein